MSLAPARLLQTGSSLPTDAGHRVVVRSGHGEGSYARVYRAAYSRTGAPCALKLAKAEIDGAGERLRREGEFLRSVGHPQIVTLLDTGAAGGLPFLVLEWLEGETLLDALPAGRRLPLREALALLDDTLAAVAHLHALGRAHGDLRPQNVMVAPGRGAVLTDPGSAPHAAPGEDVRALGALFHRMLTGRTPEPGSPCLSTAAGHNPGAVRLWERAQLPEPPAAAELLAEVRRLRPTL